MTIERWLFSAALALGSLALAVFGLGLAGLLNRWAIAGLLLLAFAAVLFTARRKPFPRFRFGHTTADEKLLLIFGGALGLLTLFQTLTPAWDYDGLMYHLQTPQLFLQAGRIYPLLDNWLTFYPALVEMLFAVGLAFGSDSFARIVHLAFAVLLALAAYAAARRFASRPVGWLAAAILIGMPIYPIWAGLAYGDMAWALFEFLAVFAALIGLVDRHDSAQRRRWPALAGALMGFALGAKYMALGGAAALGLVVLWGSRRQGWRSLLKDGLTYGGMALFVSSPWYLKNWLWTGNPVYPFYFTHSGEIGQRIGLWFDYMNGFGAPRTFSGYLLLPALLYTQYPLFATFLGSIEIPSLLFPIALAYPLTRRNPALNGLAAWAALRFIFWAAGVQQTRYLLPLFPVLSILSAHVLVSLASRLPGALGRALTRGLGLGMLAVSLVYSLIFFADVRPLGVIIGTESRVAFLNRRLAQYPLITFIHEELPPDARVWMLWDGRGYYCPERCQPDVDHTTWLTLVLPTWNVDQVAAELHAAGATHLLIDQETAAFTAQFDRTGTQQRSLEFLLSEFLPACTRELDRNESLILVELNCR